MCCHRCGPSGQLNVGQPVIRTHTAHISPNPPHPALLPLRSPLSIPSLLPLPAVSFPHLACQACPLSHRPCVLRKTPTPSCESVSWHCSLSLGKRTPCPALPCYLVFLPRVVVVLLRPGCGAAVRTCCETTVLLLWLKNLSCECAAADLTVFHSFSGRVLNTLLHSYSGRPWTLWDPCERRKTTSAVARSAGVPLCESGAPCGSSEVAASSRLRVFAKNEREGHKRARFTFLHEKVSCGPGTGTGRQLRRAQTDPALISV